MAILSNIAFAAYAFGFFFWAISFKMEKPKKTRAQIASVVFYGVSMVLWIAHYIVK